MSPNVVGALFMIASMACFTVNDTLLKLLSGAVPLFQLVFLRSAVTCTMILAARGRLGPLHMRVAPKDWRIIIMRALCEVVVAYFFLNALFNMPLANVTAILQVTPLAITLACALFLREAVGWRRMLAIGVGFVGVMLIVQPGTDGFNLWSLYALIAVAGVVLRDLLTRQLDPAVPSMTVTFATAFAVMAAAGLASLSEPWVPVSLPTATVICATAATVLGGYAFSVLVMRTGDVSFTAPFRYTGLVWALVLGWLVFGEWPDHPTLAGATIVVATGIYTILRERRIGRAKGPGVAPK